MKIQKNLVSIGLLILICFSLASCKNSLNTDGYVLQTQDSSINHRAVISEEGRVIAAGNNEYGQCDVADWSGIKAVATGNWFTVGLKEDGTVVCAGKEEFNEFDIAKEKDIISIAAGNFHTVAVFKDGTVKAFGKNTEGQCNVESWTDIVQADGGASHTVGLKKDGTVVVAGTQSKDNTESWQDIVKVSAQSNHTAGLKSDGTVVYSGSADMSEASTFENITDIDLGFVLLATVKEDGSVWVCGSGASEYEDMRNYDCIKTVDANLKINAYKENRSLYGAGVEGNYKNWSNIAKLINSTGLTKDGKVIAFGANQYNQCATEDWENIIDIARSGGTTVGVKKNGRVLAIGDNTYGQADVENWRRIKAVATGRWHTVGLKKNGTVLATGYNEYGQCDLSDWRNIAKIATSDNGTFGLTEDGKVLYKGSELYNNQNFLKWEDIADVKIQYESVYGLTKDGRVKFDGLHSYHGLNDYSLPNIKAQYGTVQAIFPSSYGLYFVANDNLHLLNFGQEDTFYPLGKVKGAVDLVETQEGIYVLKENGDLTFYKNPTLVDETPTQEDIVLLNLEAEEFPATFATAGRYHTAYINGDGTVTLEGLEGYVNTADWTDIKSVAVGNWFVLGLTENGEVVASGEETEGELAITNESGVAAIAAGGFHSVALFEDGTVKAFGENMKGQCNTEDWTDIIQVAAGDDFTLGLKRDGTVIYAGENNSVQRELLNLKDIVKIDAFGEDTAFLYKDGTVTVLGLNFQSYEAAADWSEITYIDLGPTHICAINAHGKPFSTNSYEKDEDRFNRTNAVYMAVADRGKTHLYNKSGSAIGASTIIDYKNWTDIKKLAVGTHHLVGLKFDGTVIAQGLNSNLQTEVSSWENVVDIIAGDTFTLGLKEDGTVYFTGTLGDNDLSDWVDITQISGDFHYAVGLKNDGTVVDLGELEGDKINVGTFKDITKVYTDGKYFIITLNRTGNIKIHGYDPYDQLKIAEKWEGIVDFFYADQQPLQGIGPYGPGIHTGGTYVSYPPIIQNIYGEYMYAPVGQGLYEPGYTYGYDNYIFGGWLSVTAKGTVINYPEVEHNPEYETVTTSVKVQ